MIAKGNNIKVKPKALEKVLASGIVIPDTYTPKKHQWGSVLEGFKSDTFGDIKDGDEVLFINVKCPEIDGDKIVKTKKILFWREANVED